MKFIRTFLFYGVLSICAIVSNSAHARLGHGGGIFPTALCPKGTSYTNSRGDGDGCLGAPAGIPNNITLIQHTTFFGVYAAQSGQAYTTRPPWNVAGVDYPVGIPAGTVLKDPLVEYNAGRMPVGCTVSATGNTIGGGYVACNVTSTDLTLSGFDFSGTITGGGVCYVVGLGYSGTSGHKLTYTKNYHGRGTGCAGASNNGYAIALFPGGFDNFDFENNVWDYSPIVSANGNNFVPMSLGNTPLIVTFKYNAFLNIPGDPINGACLYDQFYGQYNYVENFVFNPYPPGDQNHAEFNNCATAAGSPASHTIMEFNTLLQGINTINGTALFRISNQVGGAFTFQDAELLNEVQIANLSNGFGGNPSTSTALTEMNNTQAATKIQDNFVDKTGAPYYVLAQNTSCTVVVGWSGNYDLVSGGVMTAAAGMFNAGSTPVSGPGACK